MHFSTFFAGSLAIAGIATAHNDGGIPGGPKLFGRSTVKELKARGVLREARKVAAQPAPAVKREPLVGRQIGGTSGQCGKGVGSCAAGYCCSASGWCGQGTDYCAAPDCQFNYGSGCDANKVPAGASTSGIARPKVGSVPYGGVGIYDCVKPGMIALTYDDGPASYTADLLNTLKQNNVPATFFITGNNLGKGAIDNTAYPWANIIKRMYNEGHQIASHTWSHQDLGSAAAGQNQDILTKQQRLNQMYYNEMAIRNILGFFPTYMRPPYSDCDAGSGCQADLASLGYHIIYFDLDTQDYLNDAPTLIQTSKNIFSNTIGGSSPANADWLVIGHDIHYQTVYNLTSYMITTAKANGWTFGTVGQCLGDPAANWYRSAGGATTSSSSTSSTSSVSSSTKSTSSTSSVASSTTSSSTSKSSSTSASRTSSSSSASAKPSSVSTDGTCGGTGGKICTGSAFGNCCSQYGWCGSDTAHCGNGCQTAFGTCTTGGGGGGGGGSVVSPDGSCGGANAYTCAGSGFGNCCSQYGWCGSTTNYCTTGCQAAFGTCS